jgi:hypothetical protein
MRATELFLIMYAVLSFSTVVVLSILNVQSIDIYLALFAIEFFVASELAAPFDPAESRRKDIVSAVLLVVFAAIMIERIIGILG